MSRRENPLCAGCGKRLPEDELGPTTEDYVQDLLREAAGRTVYLESL